MRYPKRVTVIELENAPFRCARDAIVLGTQMPNGIRENRPKGDVATTAFGLRGLRLSPRFALRLSNRLLASLRSRERVYGRNWAKRSCGVGAERAVVAAQVSPNLAFGVSRWRSYKNNVEVLRGNAEYAIQPSNNTPTFDVSILLNGVCDVNGAPLMKTKQI